MDWTSDFVQSKRKAVSEWSAVEVPVDSRVIRSLFAWLESNCNGLVSSTCYHWYRLQAISERQVVALTALIRPEGYDVSRLSQHVKKFDPLLAKCYKTSFPSSLVARHKGTAGVVPTRPGCEGSPLRGGRVPVLFESRDFLGI